MCHIITLMSRTNVNFNEINIRLTFSSMFNNSFCYCLFFDFSYCLSNKPPAGLGVRASFSGVIMKKASLLYNFVCGPQNYKRNRRRLTPWEIIPMTYTACHIRNGVVNISHCVRTKVPQKSIL